MVKLIRGLNIQGFILRYSSIVFNVIRINYVVQTSLRINKYAGYSLITRYFITQFHTNTNKIHRNAFITRYYNTVLLNTRFLFKII